MERHTAVSVDIAKTVFEVAVSDEPGRVAQRRRLSRAAFLEFFAQLPAATVIMEACGSAHFWARQLQGLGHEVVLLPPHQVRPYVTRNKTDRTDAKGILEAYRNADIRPVPVKSVPQQVLVSLPLPLGLARRSHRPHQHPARAAARAGPGDPGGRGEGAATGRVLDRGRRQRNPRRSAAGAGGRL